MKTLKTVPGQNLVLGHRGENLATRIIFSIAPWVETYGPGTAHLLHQLQGDSEPYPVATLQEGTEVSWDVTDGDTALEGYGKYELRYYVAETLVKSSVGETYTMKALQYGAEPPDPIQGWVDHVLEKENEIYEAVSKTKGYSEVAERAAGDALTFANAADKSAGNAWLSAKTAADQAGQAAGSAKEAKEAAEEARKIVDGADVVKSVNGQGPDENGNVQIEVGTGSGVDVTAKPGQLIRVKSVDENGKPTAWETVPWGYTEGGMVEILPETTFTEENAAEVMATIPPFGLVISDTYAVTVNGTEYSCVATIEELNGFPCTLLYTDDMPIAIAELSPELATEFGLNVFIESAGNAVFPYTISIYHNAEVVHKLDGKFLPDGVPYSEYTGAPATDTLTFDGNIEGKTAILVDEGVYAVNISDIYVERSALVGGTLTAVGLEENDQNSTFDLTEDMLIDATDIFGVPSYIFNDIAFVLSEDATWEGVTIPKGINVICVPGVLYVSEVKAPTAVFGGGETIHKLDNRFLDLDWIPTKKAKETEILPEMFTSEYNNELKPTALPIGTVVAVYWDGVRHECTVSTIEDSEGAIYFGYFRGYPFAFLAMYESLPYTIKTADGEEHTVSVSLVEYEYNVIPSGYLGESTSVPISLLDLGMPVATGSETILATDTSEVMKKLKNGSKVKAVFKARFETENGNTDGTVTAIFDGTRYFNGASTVKDAFIFSKMICMYACLYAVTLRVEDGQYVAGVHKLLDNSATEA